MVDRSGGRGVLKITESPAQRPVVLSTDYQLDSEDRELGAILLTRTPMWIDFAGVKTTLVRSQEPLLNTVLPTIKGEVWRSEINGIIFVLIRSAADFGNWRHVDHCSVRVPEWTGLLPTSNHLTDSPVRSCDLRRIGPFVLSLFWPATPRLPPQGRQEPVYRFSGSRHS